MINIAAFISLPGPEHGAQYDGPWVSAISADDAAREFEGWEPNVQTLLKVTVVSRYRGKILTICDDSPWKTRCSGAYTSAAPYPLTFGTESC